MKHSKEQILKMGIRDMNKYFKSRFASIKIEDFNNINCVNCLYSTECKNCKNSPGCNNCENCSSCIFCTNLVNGIHCIDFHPPKRDPSKYYICNIEVTKEEFEKKKKELFV